MPPCRPALPLARNRGLGALHISKHRALFEGVRDVREWMAAAYKPELAATLGSCMQDMMHGLKAGPEGQPNVTPAS
jgi:hypothetical protein